MWRRPAPARAARGGGLTMKAMKRPLTLLFIALLVGAQAGCSKGGVQVGPATATPTPRVSTSASPAASTTAASSSITPASGAAKLVSLDGTRCIGRWRDAAASTSGAFATRLEAGGSGGAITIEVGGPVFGGSGGTVEAPFRLVGNVMEIEVDSSWLGHLSARIGLDGTASGSIKGVPVLGAQSLVTLAGSSFVSRRMEFDLQVARTDTQPGAHIAVEAACSR
jgi:hypothetical protein